MISLGGTTIKYLQRRVSLPLSYLLSIREVDLLEIFKICGFYNEKRGAFLFRVFETWVAASFDTRTVEVTTYCFPESPNKKIPLIKIGVGEHPCRPTAQLKEKLDPPRFRMQTDPKGQSSKDSLMLLFDKPPQTHTTTTESPVWPLYDCLSYCQRPSAEHTLLLNEC
jgi:hypothetical protein